MKRLFILFNIAGLIIVMAACSKAAYKESVVPVANKAVEVTAAGRVLENVTGDSSTKEDGLYPAYIIEKGMAIWGYINSDGKFVIPPGYNYAEEFRISGIARVAKGGKEGIIDRSGKFLVEPIYDYIYPFSEGFATAVADNGIYRVIDEKGKVVFEHNEYVGSFHEGLAVFSKKTGQDKVLYGYMDSSGKVAVEPQFEQAGNFNNQKAFVKTNNGKYSIIDNKGQILFETNFKTIYGLSEDVILYSDENGLKGYARNDGKKITEARFSEASLFENGFAVVHDSKEYSKSKYGVINKTGEFVIKPEYASISPIGEGMFAASIIAHMSSIDMFNPKAILDSEGKQLTEFKYYDIGGYKNGITSVSEDTKTYFIGKDGKKVDSLPVVDGAGIMKVTESGVIKAEVDEEILYYSKEGKLLWKPQDTKALSNGAVVKSIKFRPDRCLLIRYPEVSNIADKAVQDKLNAEFKKTFIGSRTVSEKEGGLYTENITTNFYTNEIKDLLIIQKESYYYPIGAAHGQPDRVYYHYNIKTGKIYTLKDLFNKGSSYTKNITDIINSKALNKNNEQYEMIFNDKIEEIRADQQFTVSDSGIKIIFQPGEIAAYAAGFLEFDIPFSEIMDVLYKEGEFYKAFIK